MLDFEDLVTTNYVVLDTETTGLKDTDEIVEISILDGQTNEMLLDTLVKPTIPIPEDATAIHGITNEMVSEARDWKSVYPLMEAAVKDKLIVIYNVHFDIDKINYCCKHSQITVVDQYGSLGYYCAMKEYSEYKKVEDFFRKTNKFIGLGKAFKNEGLTLPKGFKAHRSASDVIMVQALIRWRLKQNGLL